MPGLNYPEKYGGIDADFFYAVVFTEEISKVFSGGFMAAFAVQPVHVKSIFNEAWF